MKNYCLDDYDFVALGAVLNQSSDCLKIVA